MNNKVYHVVFDTNVLVSSLIKKSCDSSVDLLVSMIGHNIIPVYNDEIMDEYKRVLSDKEKFSFKRVDIGNLIKKIKSTGIRLDFSSGNIILEDMKDVCFYEVILEERVVNRDFYLVTGNLKHFPNRIFVVNPNELMGLIDGRLTMKELEAEINKPVNIRNKFHI